MNGERSDILYNTEQPILCDECKGKFKSKQVELEIISQFEKEVTTQVGLPYSYYDETIAA